MSRCHGPHWAWTFSAAATVCALVTGLVPSARSDVANGESMARDQPAHAAVPFELFRAWNFDKQTEGEKPEGFTPYTLGGGSSAIWLVERDSGAPSVPNIIRQSAPCSADPCFQMLIVDDLVYEYPDVTVRLRVAPTQGATGEAGLVFAARDRTTFYAATVDVSAKSVEVLQSVEGKIAVLARSPVTVKNVPWHALRVRRNTIISKEYIEVFFDAVHILSIEEKAISSGQIGLVTRGSAMVAFDNLNAAPLYSQKPLSPPAAY